MERHDLIRLTRYGHRRRSLELAQLCVVSGKGEARWKAAMIGFACRRACDDKVSPRSHERGEDLAHPDAAVQRSHRRWLERADAGTLSRPSS